MAERLADEFNLADVAEQAGMSEFQFNRAEGRVRLQFWVGSELSQ
jgi:hypothetical protein